MSQSIYTQEYNDNNYDNNNGYTIEEETQIDNEFTMDLLYDEKKVSTKSLVDLVKNIMENEENSNLIENENNEEKKDDEIIESFEYFIERNSNSENSPIELGGSAPEKNKCPGCFPIFQYNQEAHIGPCGCLGDW